MLITIVDMYIYQTFEREMLDISFITILINTSLHLHVTLQIDNMTCMFYI